MIYCPYEYGKAFIRNNAPATALPYWWGLFYGGEIMAVHPVNDRFKVKITKDEFGFGGDNIGAETGVVVEVPDMLIYLSFHSFSFEDSFMAEEKLKKIQKYYNQFLGKRIFWEKLQDRGRILTEKDGDYVYLQMTDLLAYADNVDDEASNVDQTGQAGSFNLS